MALGAQADLPTAVARVTAYSAIWPPRWTSSCSRLSGRPSRIWW